MVMFASPQGCTKLVTVSIASIVLIDTNQKKAYFGPRFQWYTDDTSEEHHPGRGTDSCQ